MVDCGGECRLEAKVFKMTGFSLGSYLGVTVAWLRAFGRPQTSLTAPGTPKPSYCTVTTTVRLSYYNTTIVLL